MAEKFVVTYYAEDNTITTLECDGLSLGEPAHGHATMQAVVRGQNNEADTITPFPAIAFIGLGWEQSS